MKPRPLVPALSRPAIAAVLLLTACGLVDFTDDPQIAFTPAEENGILPAGAPVRAAFGFAVNRASAESIFSVKDFAGAVSGRFSWEKNEVSFLPEPGLKAGGRYVLSFDGVFKDAGGAEHETHRLLPFFSAFKNEEALHIVSADPVSGSSAPGTKVLRAAFSRPVDPASFLEGFSLSPRTDHSLAWEKDGTVAVIAPKETWKNLTLYTMSFSEKIKDLRGAALAPARDSVFLVQDDAACPLVLSVETALNDPLASFPALGTDLGLLAGKDALRIVFSEEMDPETEDAVVLEPSVPGTWYRLEGGRVLAFSPADFYEAGRAYTLEIGSSAADKAGNKLLAFAPLVFTPATGFLSVRTEFAADGIQAGEEDLSPTVPAIITVNSPISTDYTFVFVFTGGSFAADEEKLSARNGIEVSCVFPSSAPSPVAAGFTWTSGNRLAATWTGFSPSSAAAEFYYLLTLKGGPGGMRTSGGNILRKTRTQLIKAKAP